MDYQDIGFQMLAGVDFLLSSLLGSDKFWVPLPSSPFGADNNVPGVKVTRA